MDRDKYTAVSINFKRGDMLIEWLDKYCKELGMTRSKLIRRLIKKERIRANRGEK
jgi:hypothetical protein